MRGHERTESFTRHRKGSSRNGSAASLVAISYETSLPLLSEDEDERHVQQPFPNTSQRSSTSRRRILLWTTSALLVVLAFSAASTTDRVQTLTQQVLHVEPYIPTFVSYNETAVFESEPLSSDQPIDDIQSLNGTSEPSANEDDFESTTSTSADDSQNAAVEVQQEIAAEESEKPTSPEDAGFSENLSSEDAADYNAESQSQEQESSEDETQASTELGSAEADTPQSDSEENVDAAAIVVPSAAPATVEELDIRVCGQYPCQLLWAANIGEG